MTEKPIKDVIEEILQGNETVNGVSTEVKNELIGIGYALLEKRNLPEDAIELFSKIIDIDPNFVGAIHWRGIAKSKAGKYEEAIADFDKELTIFGIDSIGSAAHCHKGKALVKLDRLEEAVTSFTNAIKLCPEQENYLVYRGEALFCLKRYEEALDDYTKAIEIEPEEPELYLKRGAKFKELGKIRESRRDEKKADELKRKEDLLKNEHKKLLESFLSDDTKEVYEELGLDEDAINSLIERDRKTLDGLEKKVTIASKGHRWHEYLLGVANSWYCGAMVGGLSGGLITQLTLLLVDKNWQDPFSWNYFTPGLIFGSVYGGIFSNMAASVNEKSKKIYYDLFCGLYGGLVCGLGSGMATKIEYEIHKSLGDGLMSEVVGGSGGASIFLLTLLLSFLPAKVILDNLENNSEEN